METSARLLETNAYGPELAAIHLARASLSASKGILPNAFSAPKSCDFYRFLQLQPASADSAESNNIDIKSE